MTQRFTAHGRVTNYELQELRMLPSWRGIRWSHVWASVSQRLHPRSLEEWQNR